jgi:hypothetical protein
MSPIRSLSLTLLAAGGVGLLSCATSRAQDAELPKAPAVNILNYSVRGADIDKKAKDAFIAVAKYNAEYVANPKVYANAQEVVPNIRIRTVDDLQREITRVALAPLPDGKVGIDQADYIRELGIAFDNELKAVVKTNPTPIVRINAMRLLAEACRSGAVAHYPTITGLITSPDTPPEVKYYAFQAAANLLSAYDIANPTTRLHSNNAKEVNALVAALMPKWCDSSAARPSRRSAAAAFRTNPWRPRRRSTPPSPWPWWPSPARTSCRPHRGRKWPRP